MTFFELQKKYGFQIESVRQREYKEGDGYKWVYSVVMKIPGEKGIEVSCPQEGEFSPVSWLKGIALDVRIARKATGQRDLNAALGGNKITYSDWIEYMEELEDGLGEDFLVDLFYLDLE